MPTYEYQCEGCGKQFTIVQSIAEHDRKSVVCPECQSSRVTQMISHFTAKTSRKS